VFFAKLFIVENIIEGIFGIRSVAFGTVSSAFAFGMINEKIGLVVWWD